MTLSIGIAEDAVEAPGRPITSPARVQAFSRRWKVAGVAYVALTAPLCAIRFANVEGEAAYLSALVQVGTVYWLPGFVIALVASTRTDPADRRLWRVWAAVFGMGVLVALRSESIEPSALAGIHAFAVPSSIAFALILMSTNTLLLRDRSGDRTVLVDALDLIVATVAIAVPLACVFGEAIITSPSSWFTISSSLWALGSLYCTFAIVLVRRRLPPNQRSTADAGIVLGVAASANAVGQVVYGVHDFTLPAGPFVGLHAISIGASGLFFLWAARQRSAGLERLTWRAQVRGRPAVALVVLASVPVTAGVVWWRHDAPWVVGIAVGAAFVLVTLTSIRLLASVQETARLYGRVEEADDQRRALLDEVMVHADSDRHRVAAHLHRQSAALYTAMSSLTLLLDRSGEAGATGPGLAAARLKSDLARQSDELRQLAVAVRPIEPLARASGSHALDAPIRAYVDRLWADARRPTLTIDVDPRLDLEWTTEAIALRIVQEAITNTWRHAAASAIAVTIGAEDTALVIEVVDDGCGFDGAVVGDGGRGMAALRALARFLDADMRYTSAPGHGAAVRVAAGGEPPVPVRRPRLRVVGD